MNKKILAICVLLLTTACSNATKRKIGLHKTGPDESSVTAQEKLMIPPIIATTPAQLPKPQPVQNAQ